MNEKVKKFFVGVGVFFSGVFSALLCVWGAIIHNHRNRTNTIREEQRATEESIGEIENGITSNEQILSEVRKRKRTDM